MICSGRTGETSATGFCGVITSFLSLIAFIALVVFYFVKTSEAANILQMMDKIIAIFGIGAALLGARKISGAIASAKNANIEQMVEKSLDERERKKAEDTIEE